MTPRVPQLPTPDRMDWVDLEKLIEDIVEATRRTDQPTAVLGLTETTQQLLDQLESNVLARIEAIYSLRDVGAPVHGIPIRPMPRLAEQEFGTIVVAANREKERLLEAAAPYVRGRPKVLVSGYGHYDFQDATFHDILHELVVPSLANGYPNALPHLYQCLQNAHRLGLRGAIAEFGAFQGGTTMFLAKTTRRLKEDWKIYAFDTFEGFPSRRTMWDMYDHDDLRNVTIESVRGYLKGENVEIVVGDIVDTAQQLGDQPIVLSFIDTDNYSPAMAALDVVQETTVKGGSIVFDHFTGENRFRYTLGERRAAQRLLDDPRYFNLHGTGVFYRQN